MKKVVVYLADGFEEIEALSPIDYLRRAGAEVTVVSISKSGRSVDGAHGITVNADMTFDAYLSSIGDVLPDAVVVPGGMPGASNIAANDKAITFINVMKENNKLVCAICASPAIVLSKTSALEGKKWTCYPGMHDNAKDYVNLHVEDVPFVHDENLITGRGPGAAEQFSMEIVRTLFGEDVAKKVSSAACMR